MADRVDLEALFVKELPTIERIVSALARRYALSRDAEDEFGAWLKLRIIENDYAVLAKFRGESSLSTYLAVCVAMLYREYRVAEHGRWRPSAAAARAGEVAIRLEGLVFRDGLSLGAAIEVVRSAGATTKADRELKTLFYSLPVRPPRRPVQASAAVPAADPIAESSADSIVVDDEATAEARAIQSVLDAAIRELPDDDRLLVRLHFIEDITVAEIARGLATEQKPLYRRLERALRGMRVRLEQAGVSRERVRSILGGER
jgi:RNA polymerase sigma factor (sigma-70 family)